MTTSESRADEPLDEPEARPASGSLPVEPADNGEPVPDPAADEDEVGRRARAGAERLERHRRGRGRGDGDARS
jgi:hypothetical protein